MANKYLEILADIEAKLETVNDVGIVHDYFRWNKSWKEFIELFHFGPTTQSKQIRGWEITRTGVTEHHRGCYFRHHKFRLSGYMSLQDRSATDKIFQALVDEVCNVFRNADGPEGSTWYYMNGDDEASSPPQVPIIKPKMFGNVLCHTTEITLIITERIIA